MKAATSRTRSRTPDGRRVAYSSQRAGTSTMFWKATDGNATPEKILAAENPQRPSSFHLGREDPRVHRGSSGKRFGHLDRSPRGSFVTPTGAVSANVLSGRPAASSHPTAAGSPIARTSRAGWRCMSLSSLGRPSSGRSPSAAETSLSWAPGGKQLFYLSENRVMSVDLDAGSGLRATRPRMLFERAASRVRGRQRPCGGTRSRCSPTASGSCSSRTPFSRRSASSEWSSTGSRS